MESMKKRVINSAVTLGIYLRGVNEDNPMQDCFEALLRMNDNDMEEAFRYKGKKIRQFNADELAGVYEGAPLHGFEVVRTDTGDVYDNNALKGWLCQGGGYHGDGPGSI